MNRGQVLVELQRSLVSARVDIPEEASIGGAGGIGQHGRHPAASCSFSLLLKTKQASWQMQLKQQ